jgi:Ran GTPase-activating protein 1
MSSAPQPIKLEPLGEREVVSPARAQEFVDHWTQQLLDQRAKVQEASGEDADVANTVLCDRISLTDKSYTPEAAEIIANFLREPFQGGVPIAFGIVEANLKDVIASQLTAQGLKVLQTLSDAFADSELVDVDLSDNAVGEQGSKLCKTILCKSSLQRLAMCNMGLAQETMKDIADWLTNDEYGNGCAAEKLTKIHFYNNMSGPGGCKEFSRILEKSKHLTDIRFSSTRARSEGTDIFASALDASLASGCNNNLVRLDLCDNSFVSKSSQEALFRALGSTKCLTYLNLSDCDLGDEGVKKVCHALFDSDSSLEHLNLSANDVTRRGAKHIAEYIRDCEGLKVLRMEDNELTSKGAELIAQAFHIGDDGSAIEEIQLTGNSIGTIGARALIDAAGPDGKDMPNLKMVLLNNNSFNAEVLSELEAAFREKLGELDENDSDGEADDELSSDEEEEDSDEEDAGDDDGKVDTLADAMEKSLIV